MRTGRLPATRPQRYSGGDLLPRQVPLRVPSALAGLTSLFGMGRGISLPVRPPNCQGARRSLHPQNSIATLHRCSNQDLGQLVRVLLAHCCAYTSRLSTWWSPTALTPSRVWELSSRGGLPA